MPENTQPNWNAQSRSKDGVVVCAQQYLSRMTAVLPTSRNGITIKKIPFFDEIILQWDMGHRPRLQTQQNLIFFRLATLRPKTNQICQRILV